MGVGLVWRANLIRQKCFFVSLSAGFNLPPLWGILFPIPPAITEMVLGSHASPNPTAAGSVGNT